MSGEVPRHETAAGTECIRCHRDTHSLKAYSWENNMHHGPVPMELEVGVDWRAGASQPSRTTGAIFLYILLYIICRALHIPYISKCFYALLFHRHLSTFHGTHL